MKFEKLNEDKIRITLSTKDLIEKDIDFHSFMSNSVKSQDLFLNILEEAERKIGFVTKDYKVRIEALAMNDGDFIFTVTRLGQNTEKEKQSASNLRFKRKTVSENSEQLVYKFNSFDDFCLFTSALQDANIKSINTISKSINLYEYNDTYYLVFTNINPEYKYSRKLFSMLPEFCTYVNEPQLFSRKLCERGNLIIKGNAIRTCIKYFI